MTGAQAWDVGILGQIAALLLGVILGSFLNVIRVRLPRGESLFHPPSHCTSCHRKIYPWDNIPLLSYLLLRGRCRFCRALISWKYPAVEALGALVLWMTVRSAPGPVEAAFLAVFTLSMLAVLFIDLEHQIIPDVITIPGTLLGILSGIWLPNGVLDHLLGAVAGGLGLFALAWGYRLLTGTSGMGMGDVKLMAMIGAFLGWQGAVGVVLIGSLAGSLVGILMLLLRRASRRTLLPFGSFLAPAAWVVLFWGRPLWEAYLQLWRILRG
jgi:leader peptidase (prepilin peptidase)/N-methyltransferase